MSRTKSIVCLAILVLSATNALWGQNDNDATAKEIPWSERLKQIIANTKQDDENVKITFFKKNLIPMEGDMFVDFTVQQDLHDTTSRVSLSNYVGRGKYVILDFWASWCAPCIEEMAALRHAYQNLPKDKVTIVSMAVNDSPAKTKAAAKKYKIEWEQIINASNIPLELYGFTRIPQIILFAPDGKILRKGLRGEDILTITAKYIREEPVEYDNAVRGLTY